MTIEWKTNCARIFEEIFTVSHDDVACDIPKTFSNCVCAKWSKIFIHTPIAPKTQRHTAHIHCKISVQMFKLTCYQTLVHFIMGLAVIVVGAVIGIVHLLSDWDGVGRDHPFCSRFARHPLSATVSYPNTRRWCNAYTQIRKCGHAAHTHAETFTVLIFEWMTIFSHAINFPLH